MNEKMNELRWSESYGEEAGGLCLEAVSSPEHEKPRREGAVLGWAYNPLAIQLKGRQLSARLDAVSAFSCEIILNMQLLRTIPEAAARNSETWRSLQWIMRMGGCGDRVRHGPLSLRMQYQWDVPQIVKNYTGIVAVPGQTQLPKMPDTWSSFYIQGRWSRRPGRINAMLENHRK
jgi:hypothetical protein